MKASHHIRRQREDVYYQGQCQGGEAFSEDSSCLENTEDVFRGTARQLNKPTKCERNELEGTSPLTENLVFILAKQFCLK